MWEAKAASQKFVQWVEVTLSKESLHGSPTSAKNANHMVLAFLNEKKDMLKTYIEMVEDHTVNSSTISDGSKLIIEGSTFSVEYFSKLGSLIMNSTLRQELLDWMGASRSTFSNRVRNCHIVSVECHTCCR